MKQLTKIKMCLIFFISKFYIGKSFDVYQYIKDSWFRFNQFIGFSKRIGLNLF